MVYVNNANVNASIYPEQLPTPSSHVQVNKYDICIITLNPVYIFDVSFVKEAKNTTPERMKYLKRPKKLLVKDQSTRPMQLQIKNGKESQDGLLIPEINCTAGSNKQQANLRR